MEAEDLERQYHDGDDEPTKPERLKLEDCRSAREYARFYVAERRKIVPIAVPGLPKKDGLTTGKECLIDGWTKPEYSADPESFSDDSGPTIDDEAARIGVKLGDGHSELDFDHPDAFRIYKSLYGEPGRSTGNFGEGVGRVALTITDEPNGKTVSFSIGRKNPRTGHTALVEVLYANKQVVYPPTISGRTKTPIIFFHTGKPDKLTYAEAVERARNVSFLCAIADVWNEPIGDGGRQFNSLALHRVLMDHFGLDEDDAADLVRALCQQVFGDEEWHKRCDRPKGADVEGRIGLPYLLEHLAFTDVERETILKWFKPPSKRLRGGRGHNRPPAIGINELATIIASKFEVRLNLFTDRIEVGGDSSNIDDAVLVIRAWVEAEHGFTPGKDLSFDAVRFLARANAYDPAREYLDGLVWDGIPRAETWLIDHCGAEDTPLNRAIGELHLRAAVGRIYEPGVKYDLMLILEGPQGARKSSAIAELCPSPDWFTDSVGLDQDEKRVIENLMGRWHCEIAELKGMRSKEVEHVKAFIARQSDTCRLAYGRETRRFYRRVVFWGTTNDATYLRDPTGNRRFVPVAVLIIIDVEALAGIRDQLWAEAVVRWNADKVLKLPDHLEADAAVEQEARVDEDPWEADLREALQEHHGWLTARQAIVACGVRKDARDQAKANRVANILHNRLKLPKGRTEHARFYIVGDPETARENGFLHAELHPEPPFHFTGFRSDKGIREGGFEGAAGEYDADMMAGRLPESAKESDRG